MTPEDNSTKKKTTSMQSSDSSLTQLLPSWFLQDSPDHASLPSHIELVPWNDGFVPSGCHGRKGQLVQSYPRSTPQAFQVVDNAVSATTADLLYASAVHAKVWGVYVDLNNIKEDCDLASLKRDNDPSCTPEEAVAYRTQLATQAVHEFLMQQPQVQSSISYEDWQRTHGVAVWVIASDADDETEYHLDYAEQVRFATNVIFPPIYGATLHVSPLQNHATDKSHELQGGGFHVNTNGLAHYAQYGYKTRLAPSKVSTDVLEHDICKTEAGWHHVSYKCRRGIVCDGEFPHFSGRVRALPAGMKRVVVGFNLFPQEIGPAVAKFPEHSAAFNKYVKLSQSGMKAASASTKWDLASVRANPKQAAFLKFLARKIKEKQLDVTTLRTSSA